jgi:hypothetical protein
LGGEIAPFLQQETVIFSNIRGLLAEQFAQLSALEQALLFWLAIVRELLAVAELQAMLVPPVTEVQVSEALEALQRRSLVERGKAGAAGDEQATYTLQPVVLEYVTQVLVERVSEQIRHAVWEHMISYALEQAGARDYVRQAQERLLVAPIILRLQAVYRQAETVEEQGYGPTNLISLLRTLRGDLRSLDLSPLSIRGACLQGVEMQDASLAGASIRDLIFPRPLMLPGRWPSAPGGRFGRQAALGEKCACGVREATPCIWPGRRMPTRWIERWPSARTNGCWPREAWMGRSNFGTWSVAHCFGQDGILISSKVWPLPLMARGRQLRGSCDHPALGFDIRRKRRDHRCPGRCVFCGLELRRHAPGQWLL